MSHEISVQNGVAEVVCGQNQKPWHGLGTVVSGLMTASDALAKAHLDWTVGRYPLTCNGQIIPPEEYVGVCRQDTGRTLGVVKSRYECIQNKDAFDFFDAIVGDGKAVYDTAGALRGGKQIWLLAKVDGEKLINNDRHETQVLMITSHDGSYSLMCQIVTTRVVCANTLSVALSGCSNQIKIRHSKTWKDKEAESRRVLGVVDNYIERLTAAITGMNKQLLTPEQMQQFTELLLPSKDPKDTPTRTLNMRAEIASLFAKGQGNKGNSRWDALNAVTDYADHYSTIRGDNSTRLESALLGSGAMMKQKAFDLLTSEDLMQQLLSKTVTARDSIFSGQEFQRLLEKR